MLFIPLFIIQAVCPAQFQDNMILSPSGITLPELGWVATRPAAEIKSSTWSIGAETLDRNFALYKNYKDWLGPLGVKRVRLQAGWARTERVKGVYDWEWLDEPVRDAVTQGVQPWINVSYGNPLYPGGGKGSLGSKLPQSPEALRAWEAWLRAMVGRYKDVVTEWEIWNEPDETVEAVAYADFYERSARLIRQEQPQAHLIAIGLARFHWNWLEKFFNRLKKRNALHLIDELTYHGYTANPDEHYADVSRLKELAHSYSSNIRLRQGENGAPSRPGGFGALKEHPWTEVTQAKWNLRRMMGDYGRAIPTSIFSLMEMKYPDGWNSKGLLESRDDQTVSRPKQAYHAMQHVTALFDDTLVGLTKPPYRHESERSLSLFAYEKKPDGSKAVVFWFDDALPVDANEVVPIRLIFPAGTFMDPVLVDLRSGRVYSVPLPAPHTKENEKREQTFEAIPAYDSPMMLTDRALVPLKPPVP